MELARQERLMNKPKNWGKVAYESLKKREEEIAASGGVLTKVLTLDSKVRQALEENVTIHGPLDVTNLLLVLTDDELCQFFVHYNELEHLLMQKWNKMSFNVLRCISITFTENLIELDLSYSQVNAPQLEILLVRANRLEILKLNECQQIDSQCAIVIVKLVSLTLKELYLNHCSRINNESLLWFGGLAGLSSNALTQLRCLDLGNCEVIEDKGLLAIANACRKLTFLNLENCSLVSDKGMIPFISQCKKLQLVNVASCFKLTNKSMIAMGKTWSDLMSLNLSRCALVTDKGIKQIALGCKQLQAINLAGLNKITEEAMFCLVDSCSGLLSMNLTGCERITQNGLNHLIRGMDYVTPGITFMGFKPLDSHIDMKLSNHLKMIQTNITKRQEEEIRQQRLLAEEQQRQYHHKIHHAACVIQNYISRYCKRMYFYQLWRLRVKKIAALFIQRVFRGYRGRIKADKRREELIAFYSQSPKALLIQKYVRSYLTRCNHPKVSKAIREMYQLRRKEVESALVVKIQAIGRQYLAKKRVIAWRELVIRRRLNLHHSILVMQLLVRRYLAKMKVHRRRTLLKVLDEGRRVAGLKIKVFCVEGMRRFKSKLSGEELRKFYRQKWTAAITIQRHFRGFHGREKYQRHKIVLATEHYAASQIQRIYRGTRVLHWRDMRLNVIAAFVLDRHYVERQDSVYACRTRYKAFIKENQRDSASEPDEDDGDENPWMEGYDKKKDMKYWHNFITNEISYDEPFLALAHEKDMINKRVKVFWVVQNHWYEGTISRYHKRKGRHRVEYDDGDHEWIHLQNECDRIQVQMSDGSWVMYSLYQSDAKVNEMRKMEERRQRENFKELAYRDAMQWKSFYDDNDEKTIMFISSITGELRTGTKDALDWVVQDDGFGFPCFYNTRTMVQVYEDPRFTYDISEDALQQRRYVMQELRLAIYICKDFWDNYVHAIHLYTKEDHREVAKILLQVRNSPKPVHLDSFLIRAKALYAPSSIVDRPMDKPIQEELEYATYLATRMGELLQKAEEYVLKRKDAKLQQVEKLTENSGAIVHCQYCKRETKRHLAFCPTCGKQQVFV